MASSALSSPPHLVPPTLSTSPSPSLPSPLLLPPPPPPPPPIPTNSLEDNVFSTIPDINSVGAKPNMTTSSCPATTERVRLRPLYWTKVQDSVASVWRSIQDSNCSDDSLIDYKSLRTLFIAKTRSSCRSALSSSGTSNIVRLLDCRRSQAISILLRSLPEKGNELNDLSNCEVDPNILISIADLIPPKKEFEIICSYTKEHPGSILDEPEQFLVKVSKIDHFKEKARLLLHESQFSERIAIMQTNLTMLQNASKNLYKDDEVRKVLGIILCIGNKLNTGNQRRGNARGFKLDILGKLKDVKSDDGSTNLLEYVVKSYTASRTKKVTNEFPLPCPLQLTAASRVSLEELYSDIEFLNAQVKASDQIQQRIPVLPQDKSAVFLKEARINLRKVKNQLSTVELLFNELLEYYCIDVHNGSVVYTPQKFFHLWIPFLQSFKHYWKSEQALVVQANPPLELLREELLKSLKVKRPPTSKCLNKAKMLISKHTTV